MNKPLGFLPILVLDTIADSREISLVRSGPTLGTEDDMFKLCAVGDLHPVLIMAAL